MMNIKHFIVKSLRKLKKYATGLAYAINDDGVTCTVTDIGTFDGKVLNIPPTIDGYKVTSIGDEAFIGYTDEAIRVCNGLTSITIPDSVTSIGKYAFFNCSGLTSITMPDGIKRIGDGAFGCCSSLTSITIPNSVEHIGSMPFCGCTSLRNITVLPGNTVYHSAGNCLIETQSKTLIAGCKTSIIPTDGSVTSIGECAFDSCSGLTSIAIPDSVTSIGGYAFCSCINLTSIVIPDGVTSIGPHVFADCMSLKNITIPNNVVEFPLR